MGQEPTPQLFIKHLVAIFEALKPSLHDSGVVWVNLGDTYNNFRVTGYPPQSVHNGNLRGKNPITRRGHEGLKEKDLMGIPWMFAFAMREAGWYLRSEIIWAKRNPMPESVTDRPTKSHETIFLFSKSVQYFFDHIAAREGSVSGPADVRKMVEGLKRLSAKHLDSTDPKLAASALTNIGQKRAVGTPGGRNMRSVQWDDNNGAIAAWLLEQPEFQSLLDRMGVTPDIFDIPTAPYRGAHFACVDAETECLTPSGWKRYDQLVPGEKIAQYDLGDRMLSWSPLNGVAVYQVDNQPMITTSTRDLKMVLTPNHRTLVSSRHRETRRWQPMRIIRADELVPTHGIPVSAEWRELSSAAFAPTFLELLGWYVAEGNAPRTRPVAFIYQSQSANPSKVERIRELLTLCKADFRETHRQRIGAWTGQLSVEARFAIKGEIAKLLRALAPNKELTWDVLNWLSLESLFAGLIGGDGHTRRDGRQCFIQKRKSTADLAQAIGVRLGYATKMSQRKDGVYQVFFTNKRLIALRGTDGKGDTITTSPYTGIVWCPQVDTGLWLARRDGRTFITGNTWPPRLAQRMIQAGTSEKGVCPACLTPWRRVLADDAPTISDGNSYPKTEERPEHDAQRRLHANLKAARANGATHSQEFQPPETVGWEPDCVCADTTLEPGDLDIINTPTGSRAGDDPSLTTGRAGMNRPRGENEGTSAMTRFQQRAYARQLKDSPHQEAMRAAAGSAFDHYLRTDTAGGRPIPPDLLIEWFAKGWLTPVNPPSVSPLEPIPATILDPFTGSGTTLMVARQLGRASLGFELNPKYVALAHDRLLLPFVWGDEETDKSKTDLSDLPLFAGL